MGRCGKSNDKSGSESVRIVVTEDFSAVLLHDAVANTQAKAGSLSDILGGEEGIEDAIRLSDTGAIVAEGDLDGLAGFGAHDFDAGWTADFVNRVIGVIQDVEKDLLKLVSIAIDIGQAFVEMFDDVDTVAVEVIGTQLNSAPENLVELHRDALRRHLACEAEQVLHDGLGALGFQQNHPKIFAGIFRNLGIL